VTRSVLIASALLVSACSRSDLDDGAAALPGAGAGSDAGDTSCAAFGSTLCGELCVDLQTDDANCGACGRACAPGGGCVAGVCASAVCPSGFRICNGRCVDVRSDPANCGDCNAACPSFSGCGQGQCAAACPFVASRVAVSSTHGFVPYAVTIGDLDGDGTPDLAVGGYYGGPNQATLGEADLLFNQGRGAFQGPATATLPLSENLCGLVAAPFQGSSPLDFAVCTYDSGPEIVSYDAHAGFVTDAMLSAATLPQAMAVADFNGDSLLDVAVMENDPSPLSGLPGGLVTFLNTGGGFASQELRDASLDLPILLAGDVNGDGHVDLVGLPVDTQLRVYTGRGDGSFSALPPEMLDDNPRGGALGDVNGDGKLDLVLAMSNSAAAFFGDGAGGFIPGVALGAGPLPVAAVIADFDRDGVEDVAVADLAGSTLAVFPGLGGGRFGVPSICYAGASPNALAAADLDGDGSPDVVAVDNDVKSPCSSIGGAREGSPSRRRARVAREQADDSCRVWSVAGALLFPGRGRGHVRRRPLRGELRGGPGHPL
jgi:hypothetical protein